MDTKGSEPTWLDLARVLPMQEVEKITNLSRYSLQRQHKEKIAHLSPRRRGMTLRNALAIANGE